MEEEFRALLLADAGVSALCGGRVNFGEQPGGTGFPAIILHTISNVTDMHMNGAGGLEQGRVQVDCFGLDYGSTKLLARAVIAALHFYRGGGFLMIRQLSARDGREIGSNEAQGPYRVSLDFSAAWRPR